MLERPPPTQYWHEYTQADVTDLEREIRGLLPDVETDRSADYGYALYCKLGDRVVCACQPERWTSDTFRFQSGIWRTADEVKKLLCEPCASSASSSASSAQAGSGSSPPSE